MKSHNKKIVIFLKSFFALAIFFIPIYLFISNAYEVNFANHLEYELKLQKSLYLNDKADNLSISDSKHFTFSGDFKNIFEDKKLIFLKQYFEKSQIEDILLELSLHGDFSKALIVDESWFILTFLYSKENKLYHVTITKSTKIDELERLENMLMYMLYISSLILFILFNIILSSQQKLKFQKKEILSSLDKANMYFDNAMIGFLIVDKDRKILNVNPLFCKMFGYTKDELISQGVVLLHKSQESYESWGKLVFSKAKVDSVVNIRYEMKRKNGELIWIEVSGAPFNKSKINDDGVVWTAINITDQVQNERTIENLNKNLSESLNYLRVFLDTAPVPIYVIDKNGAFIECNSAFTKVVKHRKEDIINQKMLDVIPEFLAMIHNKKDEELLYRNDIHYKEILSVDTHVTNIYEFHKTAIKENDIYNGYICVMIDVTKHEEQEDELQRKVKIEVKKNKTLALIHEQERVNDAKFKAIGQLSAGITHEINTPLTYVKGNLEMIQMDIKNIPNDCQQKEQLLEDVNDMKDGLNRIAGIVESMREMSQQGNIETIETNIYSTIITSLIMANNRSKQISKIYLNGELFTTDMRKNKIGLLVNIQAQRMEQVWIILLNNALDELQKKENFEDRKIEIKCYETTSHIVVEFVDNAGGIDSAIIENIFEPFVSSKPEGGMGVGLSVAKRIVEDQDAMIKAFNNTDGATFEVIFDKIK